MQASDPYTHRTPSETQPAISAEERDAMVFSAAQTAQSSDGAGPSNAGQHDAKQYPALTEDNLAQATNPSTSTSGMVLDTVTQTAADALSAPTFEEETSDSEIASSDDEASDADTDASDEASVSDAHDDEFEQSTKDARSTSAPLSPKSIDTHDAPTAASSALASNIPKKGNVQDPVRQLTKAQQQRQEHRQQRSKQQAKARAQIRQREANKRLKLGQQQSAKKYFKQLEALTKAVHTMIQHTKHTLPTDQFDTLIEEGAAIVHRIAKQRNQFSVTSTKHATLKQLEEELACHLRVQGFLKYYPKTLPQEAQETFKVTIAPLLRERLVQADRTVQQALVDYWEKRGNFYPVVLQNEAVSAWLSRSLCLDLAQEALVNDHAALYDRFMQGLLPFMQPTQHATLSTLLLALQAKQQTYGLDLSTLCKVVEFLPADGEQACHLLNNDTHRWLVDIKANWLVPHLENLPDQYSKEDSLVLRALLASLSWDAALTTDVLQAIKEDQDSQACKSFLLFLAPYPVEDTLLLDVLHRGPPEGQASACKAWHHTLVCHKLHAFLDPLFPHHKEALHVQLANLLEQHLDAYDALFYFLATRQQTSATPTERDVAVQQLREVIGLLDEYQVSTEVYAKALQKIADLPCNQWIETVHKLVVKATFRASHQRNVQELIDNIAQNAPGVFFAGDAQKLRKGYDDLINVYEGHSSVLKTDQPIAQWTPSTITQWAQKIGPKAQKGQVTPAYQSELLAVIKRAVELHHGFPPRDTQLLSLLTMLHPAHNTSRLAQINTGEGKSLTVAMLAALHALKGQKVDVLTTSPELSIPEVKKQTPFFTNLGLTVGENSAQNNGDDATKYSVYQKDIVYGTAEDFQGDILRTEFFRKNIRGERGFGVVLVDEVDSMLFDDRSHSIRLSGQTPAMNHLEIALGAVWNQVNQLASRLRTIEGQCYFIKEKFQEIEGEICFSEGQDLNSCSVRVEDQVAFLKEHTTTYVQKLLRKLTAEERKQLAHYQALNQRIDELNEEIAGGSENQWNEEAHKVLKEKRQDKLKELETSAWQKTIEKEGEYLEVPVHLQDFARTQVPRWAENAIYALYFYKKDQHYDVRGNKIVPIDYNNTGVLQHNTVWDNGLAQFLQIKEGVCIRPESISTNFISKLGYFQRYGTNIFGLTGTLGDVTTRGFLSEMYGTDMVTIPPYKHREIVGNKASDYLCKELPAQIVNTPEAWKDAIVASTLQKTHNGRAVLIICKYISQVKHLQEQIAAQYDASKLFTYTGQKEFAKQHIDAGKITIATNIAGRGTDLTTSAAVESCGGMHVCITFLPENSRVELQNAGRTARQGKKGSAQLILLYTAGETTIQELRSQRDQKEVEALGKAKKDVAQMLCSDRLFMRYCGTEAKFFPTMEALRKVRLSQDLCAHWQVYAAKTFTPAAMHSLYETHIQRTLQAHLQKTPDPPSWKDYTPADRDAARCMLTQEVRTALVENLPQTQFEKEARDKERIHFLRTFQTAQEVPADVLEAFYKDEVFVPSGSDLAAKYGWTASERHGSQEIWGLWFKEHGASGMDEAALHSNFDSLESSLQAAAQDNQLIRNPYYYVEKGNALLQEGRSHAAQGAFDSAIALDPIQSANARFNKARALLTPKENKCNHTAATKELTAAKYLIKAHHKTTLLTFDTLVGQTGKKPRISEHVQHQLDILSQQENYIQAALDVIKTAQSEGWDVEITELKSLKAIFDTAERNRSQALEEAACNGFTHVFTIKEKQPTPWWSIIAVAIIGLAQLTAGIFIAACSLGTGLTLAKGMISEGISDLITAVKSGIQGSFSWAEWGLKKAISLAVSLISAGWDAIKKGCATVKESAQNLARSTCTVGRSGLKVAIKRAGKELGSSVAKECVNALVDYGVDKLLIKNIEELVAKKVAEKVSRSLEQSTLVQAALALDVANKNNHWQTILLQEGLALLASKKDGKVAYAFKEIAKGVASNKIQGAQVVFQTVEMQNALKEVLCLTGNFLADFHKKLENKYKKEITTAEEKLRKEKEAIRQQEQQTIQTVEAVQVVSAPQIDEEAIEAPEVVMNENYTSDLRNYYYEAPSHDKTLGSAFSSAITSRITSQIQGDIIRPVTGALVNMSIDKMLSGVTESLEKQEKAYCEEGAMYYQSNQLANAAHKEPPAQARTQEDEQHTSVAEDPIKAKEPHPCTEAVRKPVQPISPEAAAMAQEVRADAAAGIPQAAATAAVLGRPVAIYNERGQLVEIVGKQLKGTCIKVQHHPASDTLPGHWVPYGTEASSSMSGTNNCFYDAAACQAEKVQSGAALREQVADRLATSGHTTPLYQATKQLKANNAGALMVGGREYNVNYYVDTKTGHQQAKIVYQSEKGGNETDHFNVYHKQNSEDKEGSLETQIEHKRKRGQLYQFRYVDDGHATGSICIMPGDAEGGGKDYKYDALEPEGPDTFTEDKNKRIPEGTYNLLFKPNSKKWGPSFDKEHPGVPFQYPYLEDSHLVPLLYNKEVSAARLIEMHTGNSRGNSSGCVLVGKNLRYKRGALWIDESRKTLTEIMKRFGKPENEKQKEKFKTNIGGKENFFVPWIDEEPLKIINIAGVPAHTIDTPPGEERTANNTAANQIPATVTEEVDSGKNDAKEPKKSDETSDANNQ